jgi:hypothetical protein
MPANLHHWLVSGGGEAPDTQPPPQRASQFSGYLHLSTQRDATFRYSALMLGNLFRGRSYRRCSRALFPSFHLKLDAFTFTQSVEIQLLQAAPVEKHFLPVRGPDKTKSPVTNNPLDSSLHSHLGLRMAIFLAAPKA